MYITPLTIEIDDARPNPYTGVMQDSSDEALMLSYCAGNTDAFTRLYARYKSPLYRYLVRHCHNRAIAEELYQDTWEHAIAA